MAARPVGRAVGIVGEGGGVFGRDLGDVLGGVPVRGSSQQTCG